MLFNMEKTLVLVLLMISTCSAQSITEEPTTEEELPYTTDEPTTIIIEEPTEPYTEDTTTTDSSTVETSEQTTPVTDETTTEETFPTEDTFSTTDSTFSTTDSTFSTTIDTLPTTDGAVTTTDDSTFSTTDDSTFSTTDDSTFSTAMDTLSTTELPTTIDTLSTTELSTTDETLPTTTIDPSTTISTSTQVPITTILTSTPNSTTLIPTTSFSSTNTPLQTNATTAGTTSEPNITSTSTTTEEPTTPNSTTTTPTTYFTSTYTPQTNATSTTIEITSTSTTTPLLTTPSTCHLKCSKNDLSGRNWSICAGETQYQPCGTNKTGEASWKCSPKGEFETPEPDYSNCKSRWLDDLEGKVDHVNDTEGVKDFLDEMLRDMLRNDTDDSEKPSADYFGPEIPRALRLLAQVTDVANKTTTSLEEFLPIAEVSIGITENLVRIELPWRQLNDAANRSIAATNLTHAIENTTFSLTGKLHGARNDAQEHNYSSLNYTKHFFSVQSDIFFASALVLSSDDESLEFPSRSSGVSRDSLLTLPPKWKQFIPPSGGEDFVEFSGIIYGSENANLMLPGQFRSLGLIDYRPEDSTTRKILNGKVLTFSVASANSNQNEFSVNFPDGQGVQIKFRHSVETWGDKVVNFQRKLKKGEMPQAARGTASCVYWDTKNLMWSPKGCKLISISKHETICECTHLTSFAILMDLHNYVGPNPTLEVLTLILSPISILCLVLCVVILSTVRPVRNKRTSITRHLCLCLIIGNILVLTTLSHEYMGDEKVKGLCIAAGILTHYVFLAAFCWMAVEGMLLYRMIIKVFETETYPFWVNYLLSYGISLGVVGITAAIGFSTGDDDDPPYGGPDLCWLNGNYIWAFTGPVLIIILSNFVILTACMWKAHRLRNSGKFHHKRSSSSYLTLVKGCVSLSVLLGLTWIFGYLALIPGGGLVSAYLFVIFNASQGIFIFIFHILLNPKIHQVMVRRYGNRLPHRITNWLRDTPTTSSEPSHEKNVQRRMRKQTVTSDPGPSSRPTSYAQPPIVEVDEYAKPAGSGPPNVWGQRKTWFNLYGGEEQGQDSSKSSSSFGWKPLT